MDIHGKLRERELADLAWLELMVEEISHDLKLVKNESEKKRLSFALTHYLGEAKKLRGKLGVSNSY